MRGGLLEIRDEELGKLCTRVCALLRKEDWGPDALDALRRLFLIVSATKYSRRLEKPCVALLQTTLCSPTCPEQLQLLCAAVLREMSPSDSLSLSCDHIQNTRQLGLVASVLLAQGDQQQVRSLGQRVLKVLESRQPEGPSLRHLLPVVSKVTSLAPDALHEEQTRALSKRLGDWLRYASVQQGVAHSSGGFFSTPRARQFLAWNSPPLTSDFVALLPSLVDAGTAVEMLHLLLDLPCLTAALDLQLRSLQAASERPPWDVSIRAPGCLEAFRDSQAQGLFQHLLRAQASGTVERLTPLYRLLQPLAGCARVVQCAEAVPTLLWAFFSAVTQ
ncbi:AP-5 complex subunit zeta-1, partial [Eschrichtius robustus]|nr:AP-5 complex subunit zeta-1 [Eschrichtius robustus]